MTRDKKVAMKKNAQRERATMNHQMNLLEAVSKSQLTSSDDLSGPKATGHFCMSPNKTCPRCRMFSPTIFTLYSVSLFFHPVLRQE